MKHRNQNSGVSLIIAIIFVSAFMLVMAGLFKARLQTIDSMGNRDQSGKVDYLAQGALELASYWAATHPEGQNLSDLSSADKDKVFSSLYQAAAELGIALTQADCQKNRCVGFDVVGRAADDASAKINALNASWFSVPVRATGDASPKCADSHSADDGCNWNKLYVGKSVGIPLYYVDSNGATQVLTGDFKLRVRTPTCDTFGFNGARCDINNRIILYPQVTLLKNTNYPFRNVDKDPVLIQWTMDDVKNGNSIIAWDKATNSLRGNTNDDNQNTEISSGRINDANPNTAPALFITNLMVLERALAGKDISKQKQIIDTFLTDAANSSGKPVLHLIMVNQPRVDDDNQASTALNPNSLNDSQYSVPYLEYQILTQQAPVTDSKSYITGWAEFGGFRKEFKKEIKRSTSGGGFALENF